jgi:hypothetical protein
MLRVQATVTFTIKFRSAIVRSPFAKRTFGRDFVLVTIVNPPRGLVKSESELRILNERREEPAWGASRGFSAQINALISINKISQ